MVEPRITIKIVDMENQKALYAQQVVRQYILAGHYSEKAIASHLKRKFDEAYGPTWHCIAGSNFGTFISHRQNHFLYFYVDNMVMDSSLLKLDSVAKHIENLSISKILPEIGGFDRAEIKYTFERERVYCSYSVEWSESRKEKRVKRRKKSLKASYASPVSNSLLQKPIEESHLVNNADSTVYLTKQCSGPCGRKRALKELVILGRCDHAICQRCLEEAPHIAVSLRGSGCPSRECFLYDLALLCPSRELRSRRLHQLLSMKSDDQKEPSEESCSSSDEVSETSVYLDYDTVDEADWKDAYRLVVVSLVKDKESSVPTIFKKERFPKNMGLLLTLMMLVEGHFRKEEVVEHCYITNGSSSRSNWTRVGLEQWTNSIAFSSNDDGEVRLVVDCSN